MSLRNRLLLLITLLLTAVVLGTWVVLALTAGQGALTVVFILLVILLGAGMAFLFVPRMITAPVEKFRAAVASLQAGAYRRELLYDMLPHNDEIGQLAQTFDRMARVMTRTRLSGPFVLT